MKVLREDYEEHYAQKISAFLAEVGETDGAGIPDPHLPLWGSKYETTPLRIAFIGQDTAYWGEMNEFRDAAKEDLRSSIFGP